MICARISIMTAKKLVRRVSDVKEINQSIDFIGLRI